MLIKLQFNICTNSYHCHRSHIILFRHVQIVLSHRILESQAPQFNRITIQLQLNYKFNLIVLQLHSLGSGDAGVYAAVAISHCAGFRALLYITYDSWHTFGHPRLKDRTLVILMERNYKWVTSRQCLRCFCCECGSVVVRLCFVSGIEWRRNGRPRGGVAAASAPACLAQAGPLL